MNFPVLDNLNNILGILRGSFLTIGLTLAGLMGVIAIIRILLESHNRSGQARNDRWENLTMVFICVGLLAGLLTIIGFAQQIGGGL